MKNCHINFIQRESIVKEYKAGTPVLSLSKQYGCYATTIYRILDSANVPRAKREFDSELADKLRREYESGVTTRVLAEQYGTSKKTIANYIREAGGTLRARDRRPKL